MNINKLKEVLEEPDFDKECHELISYIETITDQRININDLNPEQLDTLNQKLDEVIKQCSSEIVKRE